MFPQLEDWKVTSWALHQAALLLGPIQNALVAPRRNYLQLAMFVEPQGLVSHKLPQGGTLHVDYKNAALIYRRANNDSVRLALAGQTQSSLFEALLDALRQDELSAYLSNSQGQTLGEGFMARLAADPARSKLSKREEVTHSEPLALNAQTAGDFAEVQYQVYTALARFRARLEGHMTPLVVWPEHFDLSMLWFPAENAAMDGNGQLLNFGFAPYTPGQYEEPYFYAYPYPFPQGASLPTLPQPAFWHREGWNGVVVTYERLRKQADPTQFLEQLCHELFPILSGMLAASTGPKQP
jgi:hypothetical protein